MAVATASPSDRAAGRSHFDLFGLAPSVDVDLKALEARFRELSLAWHPDRAPPGDSKARLEAVSRTTALNDAFTALKDPIRRALYLLRLRGVDLESEAGAERAAMPLEFLEEVMERREALERAMSAKDHAAVQAQADDVRRASATALAEGQAALRRDDRASATHALGRVRYYARFLEQVDAFEEEQLS